MSYIVKEVKLRGTETGRDFKTISVKIPADYVDLLDYDLISGKLEDVYIRINDNEGWIPILKLPIYLRSRYEKIEKITLYAFKTDIDIALFIAEAYSFFRKRFEELLVSKIKGYDGSEAIEILPTAISINKPVVLNNREVLGANLYETRDIGLWIEGYLLVEYSGAKAGGLVCPRDEWNDYVTLYSKGSRPISLVIHDGTDYREILRASLNYIYAFKELSMQGNPITGASFVQSKIYEARPIDTDLIVRTFDSTGNAKERIKIANNVDDTVIDIVNAPTQAPSGSESIQKFLKIRVNGTDYLIPLYQ